MPIVYFFVFISSLFILFYSLAWSIDYDFDNPKIITSIKHYLMLGGRNPNLQTKDDYYIK